MTSPAFRKVSDDFPHRRLVSSIQKSSNFVADLISLHKCRLEHLFSALEQCQIVSSPLTGAVMMVIGDDFLNDRLQKRNVW